MKLQGAKRNSKSRKETEVKKQEQRSASRAEDDNGDDDADDGSDDASDGDDKVSYDNPLEDGEAASKSPTSSKKAKKKK